MNARAEEGSGSNELQVELKYCERCGALWLRPAAGGQIYCVACAREMAQLPPVLRQPEALNTRPWLLLDSEDIEFDGYEERDTLDTDFTGGVE